MPELLDGLAKERYLPGEVRAPIADQQVQAQPDPLQEAEVAVEAFGDEVGRFLAGELHVLNQFCCRHSRSAMRAR